MENNLTQTQLRKMKVIVDVAPLLIFGVSDTSYKPHEVLAYIGEQLTRKQYDAIESFLTYVTKYQLTFGNGNILEVLQDWVTNKVYEVPEDLYTEEEFKTKYEDYLKSHKEDLEPLGSKPMSFEDWKDTTVRIEMSILNVKRQYA
jgi:hypothetical protein